MGLKKYGKGDWRNISRNFVVTRTPTQVASHAQKYFIRQLSGGKDKRRASIHDITTVNLTDPLPSPDSKISQEPYKSHPQQASSSAMPGMPFPWNEPNDSAAVAFNPTNGNVLLSSPYGQMQRNVVHESFLGPQDMAFQMQSSEHYQRG